MSPYWVKFRFYIDSGREVLAWRKHGEYKSAHVAIRSAKRARAEFTVLDALDELSIRFTITTTSRFSIQERVGKKGDSMPRICYVPKNFRADRLEIIAIADEIIAEYAGQEIGPDVPLEITAIVRETEESTEL